jgi:hypothetical protein
MINVEKNVSRLLFHFFFFLICVCITWVWLGWRWGECVVMYCSSFRNFTFCFYWFLFYFRLVVYICVDGVFLYGVCFNVCLFAYLFCCFISFFSHFLYLFIVYVMWLYFINFSLKVYVALKWDYHILFVYSLIVYTNVRCILENLSQHRMYNPVKL